MRFPALISGLLLCLNAFGAPVKPSWTTVAPGIWKAVIGEPEILSPLKAAGAVPAVDALKALPSAAFPLDEREIAAAVADHKIYLRFPLEKDERIYGLGLNFRAVNQRGSIKTLRVDHYGGTDNGRTHAPVPFYVSSKGYGVLVDAARYITVYAGTGVRADSRNPPPLRDRNTDADWDAQPYSDAVEILVPAEGAEVYVFAGPTPLAAVQRYNLMNGGGALPPKWGLGFVQRVPTLFTQDDVLNEARAFEAHDFPLDVIGLEPGWQSMAYPCTFEWDPGRFPDPKTFLETLAARGVRANLWLNPYVSPKASIFERIKPWSGSHTVWNGLVPDLSAGDAVAILKETFRKRHIDLGVSGYKIDEVDGFDFWLWPDVAMFPSGSTAEQMRQVYGLLMQRLAVESFRDVNRRTYGLVRGTNAGAGALPFVLYNDSYSHREFITALINSGFIGVLWTPEVRASKSAEEWVRRFQTVCFSPMAMINAWADGTKPWSFPDVEGLVRDAARLRIRLIPYLYTAFARYHFEGLPPFRSTELSGGTAGARASGPGPAEDGKDQYLAGEDILVAPLFEKETKRRVHLPEGKWYDFYTGEYVGENQTIEIAAELDRIPLFVRDGGIIPMIPAGRQAPRPGEKPVLEIRHYGEADGKFLLYDDDGISFDYEKGAYSFIPLIVEKDRTGRLKGRIGKPPAGKPFNYSESVTWRFMTASKRQSGN